MKRNNLRMKMVTVTTYENKTFMADIMGGKSCVLDVKAQLPSGAYVNVEVQLKNQHNMDRRSLFYLSKTYTKDLKAGSDYIVLPNVIAINILGYNYPRTKKFHSCFRLREDAEHEIILTDALEIHFINMVKYRKQKKALDLDDPLCRWLAWFDKNSPRELREEVIKMDTAIMSAEEKFKLVETVTDEEWHSYMRHFMAECDKTSEINYARGEEAQKWQSVVSDCKAEIAEKDAEIERLRALLKG